MAPKVNIIFKFTAGPWGGANQFLKSLKNYLTQNHLYANDPRQADVVIFNSHHRLLKALWFKFIHPDKTFIHRLDNLMLLARGNGREIDSLILSFASRIADAVVFQSEWSRERFCDAGLNLPQYHTVIHNAPDREIFYIDNARTKNSQGKTRLIAVSWSRSQRKGFSFYSFLDEHLDFNKFSLAFVGNSPVKFKRINNIPALNSRQLAGVLRQQDIFISASTNEACPNVLLEAMHCGLVPVVINSGAHSELLGSQGLFFNDASDALAAINKAADNIGYYRARLKPQTIEDIGASYSEFCALVYSGSRKKGIGPFAFISLFFKVIIHKLSYTVKPG